MQEASSIPNKRKLYYQNLFPFDLILSLFTCGGRFRLSKCEFVFKLYGHMTRYNKFCTQLECLSFAQENQIPPTMIFGEKKLPWMFFSKDQFVEFVSTKKPDSIHFGAIYPNVCRTMERKDERIIKYRPLVFDIDINDYDRSILKYCRCGTEKKVCDFCWQAFMTPALRVLNYFLSSVMGFKRILPVFSGRRGFHIWVFDERVWSWTSVQRKHFVQTVLLDKSIFNQHYKHALELLRYRNPVTKKYDDFEMYQRFFPKLDIGVTTDVTHLTKMPFTFHAETGYLCLPIGENFRPQNAIHVCKITKQQIEFIVSAFEEKIK